MAVFGFEGFEKRLELQFSGDHPATGKGLRQLDFFLLEKVLLAVQCTVVSAMGNNCFDSYVLSESSLFVYPTKIIIKTCGTTQLLESVCPLVDHASKMGLTLRGCRYTRGSFIFPSAQPYPHTSFEEEVVYLERNLPKNVSCRKSTVLNPKSCYKWHVFTACDCEDGRAVVTKEVRPRPEDHSHTVEICMTGLDRVLAKKFFLRFDDGKTGDSAGKEMTKVTGIWEINRNALICDFAFNPCGYSMNGMDSNRYSTVHVTPEDGFSYASFECVGSVYDDREEFFETLRKVVKIFRPASLSVSTTCAAGHEMWRGVANALEPLGLRVSNRGIDEFPGFGILTFQTFTRRNGAAERRSGGDNWVLHPIKRTFWTFTCFSFFSQG